MTDLLRGMDAELLDPRAGAKRILTPDTGEGIREGENCTQTSQKRNYGQGMDAGRLAVMEFWLELGTVTHSLCT